MRAREQVTRVYREAWRRVWLDDDPQESVHALCYVVDRGHGQYAGRLSLTEQLHYARQGHGRSGACRDYVLATVKELRTLGIRDADLQTLAEQLKGSHRSTLLLEPIRLKLPNWLSRSVFHFRAAFRDQARRRAFNVILQPLEKLILAEPRRNRIENLHHHRSGKAAAATGAARTGRS